MVGSTYWSYDSSLRGPNQAIGAELTRITPDAIAGAPQSLSTGTGLMTLSWRSDGGQTLISYPAACSPQTNVLKGTASVGELPGDYLSVTAAPGRAVTIAVRC